MWDFKLVLNPDMDCHNYKTVDNPRARARLIDIISEQNLIDTFGLLHHLPGVTLGIVIGNSNQAGQARLFFVY